MCGICGIVQADSIGHVDLRVLKEMNQRLVHRGPDDDGFYVDKNVGLAMRRLSIIDLHTGKQPITNEDGTIWIVYNGEIYNHATLRAELQSKGHRFQTKSDTETIVHLYEEFGEECVQYLQGMFAFAIWDANKRILFVARDRLGIKPFYYLHSKEVFLFASEIKSILAHPGVTANFNHKTLPEYLAFGYLSGTRTFFQGIQKLAPGHVGLLTGSGEFKTRKYWEVPSQTDSGRQSMSFYVDGYRDLLNRSVQSHLMSDVPLGVFLSGGIDSSAIAALMAASRKDRIETFSVGYSEQAYSELPYAELMARHIGSNHHEVRISRQEFFDELPKLIWHEDEPLVWPSSVSLYFVARLARERVKVVLTGEGSDETLAGYTRYPFTLWNAKLDASYRRFTPIQIRGFLADVASSEKLSSSIKRKLHHTFLARNGSSWTTFYFDNFYAAFSEADQHHLLSDDLQFNSGDAYRDTMAFWDESKGSLLSRMLFTDIKSYLVELCMKQDQMSMAASIESRVPFLDHKLVEFALSIPAEFKTRGLAGKRILKAAMQNHLPKEILNRSKMGFPTPVSEWLLGPQLEVVEKAITDEHSMNRGLFKPDAIKNLFAQHKSKHKDHSTKLWRLLNLELWHRVFIDGESAPMIATTANAFSAHS